MHYEYKGWTLAVLIAVDQFGNAVGGGNPDSTIYARVGYFSANPEKTNRYWRMLESVIDFAFYPIDGENHCYNAAQADKHGRYEQGNDITQFVLSMIIFIVCPFIAIALRLLSPIFWFLRYLKSQ